MTPVATRNGTALKHPELSNPTGVLTTPDYSQYDNWEDALEAIAKTPATSDIFISSWGRVRLRHRRRYITPELSRDLIDPELGGWGKLCRLFHPEEPEMGPNEFGRQGGIQLGSFRYRISRVKDVRGEEFTLRILPAMVPTPQGVLLPDDLVRRFIELKDGLVVFAGGTGHGKSTSIAALLSENARKHAIRTVCIEDPVEYVHADPSNGSTFTYRGVHDQCRDFASALEDALRMFPDIIMVGEVRTKEAAETAIHAALSGHKVVCTTHGGSVEQAMHRMGDLCAELGSSGTGALAQATRIVVAQQLLPAPSGMLVPLHEIMTSGAAAKEIGSGRYGSEMSKSIETKIRAGAYFALSQEIEMGSRSGMQTYRMSYDWHVSQRRLPPA